MSNARIVDTDLATLIQAMGLEPDSNSIAMIDVETNNPSLSNMKRTRIFDFGYGTLNPISGDIGKIHSEIVYEGIIHPKIIEQIIEWKKIKEASFNSYYGFFNLLVQHDWWHDRVITKKEISDEALLKFKKDMREKLYDTQNVLLPRHQESLRGWRGERSHHKNAAKQAANREADINKAKTAIEDLNKWIEMDDKLDAQIKGGSLVGHPTYDQVMEGVYLDLYKDQYERINWEGDLNFFRRIEQITGANFIQDMGRWGDIISAFDNSLKNNKNLLAITAYNISHETRAIKDMTEDFGPAGKGYEDILGGDRYRKICMNNMMGLISKQEVEEIINGLNSYDSSVFVEGLEKAFTKTGKLNTQTFELLYKHVFPAREYTQKHTAKEDVFDQSEVFIEMFQKHIVPYLERGE